jgi:hypothetical protein
MKEAMTMLQKLKKDKAIQKREAKRTAEEFAD